MRVVQLLASAACRYLSRLLLLHGRWSYMRNKEVVLYSFYKNWAYVLVYVYLQFVAGEWACMAVSGSCKALGPKHDRSAVWKRLRAGL
jgi:hypothetical protein